MLRGSFPVAIVLLLFVLQVVEDMTEECSKYGTVAAIEIPHVGGGRSRGGLRVRQVPHTRGRAEGAFWSSWEMSLVFRRCRVRPA